MMRKNVVGSGVPAALQSVTVEPLFVLTLQVTAPLVVGDTPRASRRIGVVQSGTFVGDAVSGKVVNGSSDWIDVRSGGVTALDARLILETDDGVLMTMSYRGLRVVEDAIQKRMDSSDEIDPAAYYFRIAPSFEAPPGKYEWLNLALFIGVGQRLSSGPVYQVFQIL